jgi:tyrosine-protein kinase Etk/Wzc
MSETQNPTVLSSEQGAVPQEVNLIDVLILLAKNKKLVLGLPVIFALMALAISFAIPPVYRASATILPPQQSQSGGAALLAQLSGAGGMVASATGIKNPNDLYIGMLQSRRVADVLLLKFALLNEYDTDSAEKARKKLAENTSISSGKDNMITITVEDQGKQRVAKMANQYVEELVKLTHTLAVTEAGQRRLFYERQLEQVKNNLAEAESHLKSALDTHGVINVDVESRGIVEIVSRLRAQISAKQIQLNALKAFITPNNADYKQAEEQLASLRGELEKLENGRGNDVGSAKSQEGLQNIKILRDIKYYQSLYEVLAKQYEVARLDEARDVPIVQVLDSAVEPERKAKPQRGLLAVSGGLIGLFFALALVFFRATRSRLMTQSGFRQKWTELRAQLRPGVRPQ